MVIKSAVRDHFNLIAQDYDMYKKKNRYYYEHIKRFISENVPAFSKVLEVGCGTGELLHYTKPSYGFGVDISEEMIQRARNKFSQLNFEVGEVENIPLKESFDYVLMIDLLDHIYDVWDVLEGIEPVIHKGTTLCIATINPLWQPIFYVAEALKLKMPEGPHNFLRMNDICNLLEIFDYQVVKKQMRFLIPKNIPFISDWINKIIPHIPILRNLCAVQTIVARKLAKTASKPHSVSVIIPCHNEEGNIEACINAVPQMGKGTEVIFVNDGSTDGTLEKIEALKPAHPHVKVISYTPNQGKGNAVRRGFDEAEGNILMILDADLTVPGSDLPFFYQVLATGKARFVNGSRHVYPQEQESMRTANLWGNQFFAMIMSWILSQHVSDTLCGTKALFKKDYEKIPMGRDKWGDYDLLFGAADLQLKIAEVPIHYKKRVAGVSKMKTLQHGWLLAKICAWGVWRKLTRKTSPKEVETPTVREKQPETVSANQD